MNIFRTLGGILASAAMAASAFAVDAPLTRTTIDVNAEIVAGCLIRSGGLDSDLNDRTDVAWGSIDFGVEPATGEANRQVDTSLAWNESIRVICTPGIDLAMRVDNGANGARVLRNAETGSTLQYYLYSDATMSAASEIPVDTPVDLTPFGIDYSDIRFPIFARVMLPEVSASGSYTDTVRVTLEW